MTKPVFLKIFGYHQQPSLLHKLYSTDSLKNHGRKLFKKQKHWGEVTEINLQVS